MLFPPRFQYLISESGRVFIFHSMINQRINILDEADTIRGIGIDFEHYFKVRKKRAQILPDKPQRESFKEEWETREGYTIDGTKFNTRKHPLHEKRLYDKQEKRVLIIDGVYKHHHYGFIIKLLAREEGTKSHCVLDWESVSCHCPITLEGINKNRERFYTFSP